MCKPTIDDQIKFFLSKEGVFSFGGVSVSFEESIKKSVSDLGIDPRRVSFSNAQSIASWAVDGEIKLHEGLRFVASLLQILFLTAHEFFHIKLGHSCREKLSKQERHEREDQCDSLALRCLIDSGRYSLNELYNAIDVFGDVIDECESETHPSSKHRRKRLLKQLKEYV